MNERVAPTVPSSTDRKPVTDLRAWLDILAASDGLPALTVDPELMSLALRQLIDNALKYSPPGSPVEITAARSDGLR